MKRTLILTMGLIATAVLAGCGAGNPTSSGYSPKPGYEDPSQVPLSFKERLIGRWNAKDGSRTISFSKDGEVNATIRGMASVVTISGAYRIAGDRLILEPDPSEKGKDTSLFTTYAYAIEAEMLILTTPDGKATAWVRMPSPMVIN